ncbi:MAG TPA: hypothetical protein VME66_05580 [Candidatus Acidoferrales bacterium]|nr:hypothetical protein [Candidatus Acidoferrales bacterium]
MADDIAGLKISTLGPKFGVPDVVVAVAVGDGAAVGVDVGAPVGVCVGAGVGTGVPLALGDGAGEIEEPGLGVATGERVGTALAVGCVVAGVPGVAGAPAVGEAAGSDEVCGDGVAEEAPLETGTGLLPPPPQPPKANATPRTQRPRYGRFMQSSSRKKP